MEKKLLQVIRVVREEIDLYQALVRALEQRTDLLVEGDMPSISANNETTETLVLKIKGREDELQELLKSIANELEISAEALTLSYLARVAVLPHAAQLQACYAALTNILVQVKRHNHRNEVLFNHTQEYLQVLGSLVIGTMSSYQGSGALQPPALRTAFVSQEA
ncbi:MAG: flagellar protein FlgN [Acidobacteria bacterium]|nr:flagellar protein FlgN [Acidobacteriota bacterium]MBI3657031.1 flagellar protein FlgN [Acidobacteriota bacterium]